MILFPVTVVKLLIHGALLLTGLGVLTLLYLLYRDKKNRSIW